MKSRKFLTGISNALQIIPSFIYFQCHETVTKNHHCSMQFRMLCFYLDLIRRSARSENALAIQGHLLVQNRPQIVLFSPRT